MSEPKLIEISASASAGGKVQIIKYDESSDYFVSLSQKYTIPDDWTAEEATEFQIAVQEELREHVDALAQIERDERFDQSYLSD